MKEVSVLNVFTNEKGEFGNPVGVIVDEENSLDKGKRQRLAANSGFSEVVFIDNIQEKRISIFSPKREIPFAGHAVVGTVYFLIHEYKITVKQLISMKGAIETWSENDLTWVRGELSITPPWNYEQLNNPLLVEEVSPEEASSKRHIVVWSWENEKKGIIRARTFATDWGIPEDEANGSGSMKLAADLGRNLVIHHGKGSIIYARPSKPGFAEVGGRVRL